MKINEYSKKTYLIGFVFVILLNICLTIFLIKSVLAQTSDISKQKPLIVEIVAQNESPAVITSSSVDNTAELYQTVNYSVQNVSSKKIRAFVLLHADQSGIGGTSTSFFQSFIPGQIIQNSFIEERSNIKSNDKIFLSFDFVVFQDGSSWGRNSQKQSEYIFGHIEGQKDAVKYVKPLLADTNKDAVSKLLLQQLTDINPPALDGKKTAEWQRGFAVGYRFVIGRLQFAYEKQGMEAVRLKLEEVEKSIKAEDK
jgi:hypothetical protein